MNQPKEYILSSKGDRSKSLKREDGKWILELEDRGDIVNRLAIDQNTARTLLIEAFFERKSKTITEAVNDFMEEARTEKEQRDFFKGICEGIVHDFQIWLGYTNPISLKEDRENVKEIFGKYLEGDQNGRWN